MRKSLGIPPKSLSDADTASATRGGEHRLLRSYVTAFRGGGLAIALSAFSGALLADFVSGLILFVNLVVALGCGIWAWGSLAGVIRTDSGLRAIIPGLLAMAMMVTTNIMAYGLEHRLFGSRSDEISVSEAPDHPWATTFTFRDGRVLENFSSTVPIIGKGAHRVGTAYVAPIVPEGWTPQQGITLWAVATDKNIAAYRQQWMRSAQGAVRVIGQNVSDYRKAIDIAEKQHHLHSAGNSVLVQWTANAADIQAETWWDLARLIGIALGVWIILMIGTSLFAGRPAKSW